MEPNANDDDRDEDAYEDKDDMTHQQNGEIGKRGETNTKMKTHQRRGETRKRGRQVRAGATVEEV